MESVSTVTRLPVHQAGSGRVFGIQEKTAVMILTLAQAHACMQPPLDLHAYTQRAVILVLTPTDATITIHHSLDNEIHLSVQWHGLAPSPLLLAHGICVLDWGFDHVFWLVSGHLTVATLHQFMGWLGLGAPAPHHPLWHARRVWSVSQWLTTPATAHDPPPEGVNLFDEYAEECQAHFATFVAKYAPFAEQCNVDLTEFIHETPQFHRLLGDALIYVTTHPNLPTSVRRRERYAMGLARASAQLPLQEWLWQREALAAERRQLGVDVEAPLPPLRECEAVLATFRRQTASLVAEWTELASWYAGYTLAELLADKRKEMLKLLHNLPTGADVVVEPTASLVEVETVVRAARVAYMKQCGHAEELHDDKAQWAAPQPRVHRSRGAAAGAGVGVAQRTLEQLGVRSGSISLRARTAGTRTSAPPTI